MIIGVDFDNTIVCYDALFHRIAVERGLVPAGVAANKNAIRDHLRAAGREPEWTALQGCVYGPRLAEADPFPGVYSFFRACRERGITVCIISHKTRHPFIGEPYDLHAAAQDWLVRQGFLSPDGAGLSSGQIFFELSKTAKLERIAACGCTHFIDDLPEVLNDPTFPADLTRCLFDPQGLHPTLVNTRRFTDWPSLQAILPVVEPLQPALETIAAGCGLNLAPIPLVPVRGGANNRVYRVSLANGDAALMKHYFQHPDDPRDRFASERAFYRYAEAIGLTQIPKVLGWDERERLGVFSFVRGHSPAAANPVRIEAAMQFVAELNRQRHLPDALNLPTASEACFSLDAHISSVQLRVDRMRALPIEDDLDAEANSFAQNDLMPAWESVRIMFRNLYDSTECSQVLPEFERCISPSDFGFHNTLVQSDGSTIFLDFEYAGWDDPAKLVGDFFCQPEVPVPPKYFERFILGIAAALHLPDTTDFAMRCRALLPVYQIKWSCILLNDFTRLGRARRGFSLGAAANNRRRRQLARAHAVLESMLQAA